MINTNEESVKSYYDKFKKNLIETFKGNIIPALTAGIILMSTMGTNANAIDFNLNISFNKSNVVNDKKNYDDFLLKNSLQNFNESFFEKNKLSPENMVSIANINLIKNNAFVNNSSRFKLKALNLETKLLDDISQNNSQNLLSKVYMIHMKNILLDKELSFEKKISLIEDKFLEYDSLSDSSKLLNSNNIQDNEIKIAKFKENDLLTSIANKSFEDPKLNEKLEYLKMFTDGFKIKDGNENILSEKDKTLLLNMLEKSLNTLNTLEEYNIEKKVLNNIDIDDSLSFN